METVLDGLVLTLVLAMLILGSQRYLTMGLLAGLAIWIRPDAITLAGPVGLGIVLQQGARRKRLRDIVSFLIGFGAVAVPYVLLNLRLSGVPMPNTFYAKQAEYAAWQARPAAYRLAAALAQLLVGPNIVLLPAAIGYSIKAILRKKVPVVLVAAWCLGYFALYSLRLPPYQHARYLMPALPAMFILGLLGFLEFSASNALARWQWATQRAWRWALIFLTLAFVVLGARAYGEDVGLIESEMVTTAKWVAANVPADALVAAHDIGALGYFDDHRLLDLAGLISPDVVPFIRDETRLAAFMDARGARYLVAFPSLYPRLIEDAAPIFSSSGTFAPELGQANMTVYCWRCTTTGP
jgi:hypothetical protein